VCDADAIHCWQIFAKVLSRGDCGILTYFQGSTHAGVVTIPASICSTQALHAHGSQHAGTNVCHEDSLLSPPSGKLQVVALDLQIQLVMPSPPPDSVSKQANSDKHY